MVNAPENSDGVGSDGDLFSRMRPGGTFLCLFLICRQKLEFESVLQISAFKSLGDLGKAEILFEPPLLRRILCSFYEAPI
jgi:hypothetical protein